MIFEEMEFYRNQHGIYQIKNLITGEVYIGQTVQGFLRRFQEHRGMLEHNNHFNKHLQRSFNKYGSENFKFSVLESVENNENLDGLETKYISEAEKSFNILAGGGEAFYKSLGELNKILNTGKKASEETKLKMSKARTGKPHDVNKSVEKRKEKLLAGEKLKTATLTIDEVREIKIELMKDLKSQDEIAKKFNVKKSTISAIMNNRSWTFVEVEGWSEFVDYCKTTPWRQRKANARTTDNGAPN